MDEYYRAVKALPAWLAAPLAQLPAQTAVRVQELRLRIGCAVTFTVQGRQCAASVLPGCPPALAAMRLDALQIEEIFYTLCNGSVHTHERELAEGYLTTAAGNRVGVAGQFVQREGQSIALQKVTSLNLRMALEQGFFSGVDFIASIHAPDAAQAQCRPQVQTLLQRGMLRQLVVLAGRETPGCIQEVCAV